MTIQTLFLRASEAPEHKDDMEYPCHKGSPGWLFVPIVRPRLEFVLEGERIMCDKCQIELEVGHHFTCTGTPDRIPVRAYEIIAGEPGRVKDGRLRRYTHEWGYGLTEVGDAASDAPWREAWEHHRDVHSVFPENDPAIVLDGPVWLIGPSVMGNFYGLKRHELRRERCFGSWSGDVNGFFQDVKEFIEYMGLWGIEFRLGEEPVARVMREEMGL